jgi:hypothetical protein
MAMCDPSAFTVDIKKLSRRLNDLMADTAKPDTTEIIQVATDMRDLAGAVRRWAYYKQEDAGQAAN